MGVFFNSPTLTTSAFSTSVVLEKQKREKLLQTKVDTIEAVQNLVTVRQNELNQLDPSKVVERERLQSKIECLKVQIELNSKEKIYLQAQIDAYGNLVQQIGKAPQTLVAGTAPSI